MVNKNITIQVGTNVDLSEVKDLESLLQKVGNTTVNVNVKEQELIEAENHLKELKGWAEGADIDLDVEIAEAEARVKELKEKMGQVDDEPIKPVVDNISAMESLDQIGQGFDRLRNGASELGQQVGTVLESAGKQETNKTFLEMSIGAEQAGKKMEEINKIVQELPGDDTALQGLLSSATAKNASLTTKELKNMGTASADYFSAMSYYGKSSIEAQQDMTNYLLAGNTAELERSPILSSHIDKLKEATTVQERSVALQEALNEEGWGGMSQQDTYNNTLETFNGMLERGRYNLGGMLQDGAKAGMELVMQLDSASGGLVGMGIALSQMASPLTDTLMGIGQIGMGLKGLRDAGDFLNITGRLSGLKTALINVGNTAKTTAINMASSLKTGLINIASATKTATLNMLSFAKTMATSVLSAVKNAGLAFLSLGKQVLISGYNALKSAGMWIVQKTQLILSTAVTYAMATAQALLNIVMSMNPIMLVVIAIIALIAVLVYLYYNVDVVRQAIDNLGASIIATAQWIYNGFMSMVNIISSALSTAWGVITRFGSNIVNGLMNAGRNAVNGFVGYIKQLPSIVMGEFNRVLGLVNDFINTLPSRVWDMGVAIIGALKSALGIGSPGHMFYMIEGEFNRIDDLTKKTSFDTGSIGQGMVDNFNPNLQTGNADINNGMGNNITINIESVDNEERIQQIVEAVEQALKFDNLNAGRTV